MQSQIWGNSTHTHRELRGEIKYNTVRRSKRLYLSLHREAVRPEKKKKKINWEFLRRTKQEKIPRESEKAKRGVQLNMFIWNKKYLMKLSTTRVKTLKCRDKYDDG